VLDDAVVVIDLVAGIVGDGHGGGDGGELCCVKKSVRLLCDLTKSQSCVAKRQLGVGGLRANTRTRALDKPNITCYCRLWEPRLLEVASL